MEGALVKALAYFIETFGAMDMLFDVLLEGQSERVGTGRLV